MALLIISSMRTIFLYGKMQHQVEKSRENFYLLENMASILVNDNLINRTCKVINLTSSLEQSFMQNACKKYNGKHSFEYVLYNLEHEPCLKIGDFAADLMWLALRQTNQPQMILRARVALPTHDKIICEDSDVREINAGLLGIG